jgi:hypothetical protein
MISNLLFDNLSFNLSIIKDSQIFALELKIIIDIIKAVKINVDFLIFTNINIFRYLNYLKKEEFQKQKSAQS